MAKRIYKVDDKNKKKLYNLNYKLKQFGLDKYNVKPKEIKSTKGLIKQIERMEKALFVVRQKQDKVDNPRQFERRLQKKKSEGYAKGVPTLTSLRSKAQRSYISDFGYMMTHAQTKDLRELVKLANRKVGALKRSLKKTDPNLYKYIQGDSLKIGNRKFEGHALKPITSDYKQIESASDLRKQRQFLQSIIDSPTEYVTSRRGIKSLTANRVDNFLRSFGIEGEKTAYLYMLNKNPFIQSELTSMVEAFFAFAEYESGGSDNRTISEIEAETYLKTLNQKMLKLLEKDKTFNVKNYLNID